MNMETGICKAPTTGRYYFSFTTRSVAANNNNNVQLRVKGSHWNRTRANQRLQLTHICYFKFEKSWNRVHVSWYWIACWQQSSLQSYFRRFIGGRFYPLIPFANLYFFRVNLLNFIFCSKNKLQLNKLTPF